MANKMIKRLKRVARKEKGRIVSRYMTENWDQVLVSAVKIIRRFKFKNRLSIALMIIFKPLKLPKEQAEQQSMGAVPEASGAM
jgi:hypothetical protein